MTRSLDLAISDGRECERLRFESYVLWGGGGGCDAEGGGVLGLKI
jgi:hypothetical protein